MMNIIKFMNESKTFNIGSIDRIINSSSFNLTEEDKTRVIGEIYKIRNGIEKQNSKDEDRSHMEKKVQTMKKDFEGIQKNFIDDFKSFQKIKEKIKFENFVYNKSSRKYNFTQEEKDLSKIEQRVEERLDEVIKSNKKNPLKALTNPK